MENETHVDRELENLDLHSFLRVVRNLSRFLGDIECIEVTWKNGTKSVISLKED